MAEHRLRVGGMVPVCADVAHDANIPLCVCTRVGIVCPAAPGVLSGGFVRGWAGAAKVRGVSIPNGSFSSQENSDVFLSTVDTDWKVGPAVGSAAHPWVSHETAACAWGRLWGTEWIRDVAVPFPWGCSVWSVSVHGVAHPSWSLSGGDRGMLPGISVVALGCGWWALGHGLGTKP